MVGVWRFEELKKSGLPRAPTSVPCETSAITRLNQTRKNSGNMHESQFIRYKIGSNEIVLPRNHALPYYQSRWKRYDTALGRIASAVFSKYGNSYAVDIGANVGDSAALMCKYRPASILCVEGSSEYTSFLEENATLLQPSQIFIEKAFIGETNSFIDRSQIVSTGAGTSKIIPTQPDTLSDHRSQNEKVEIITFATLLERWPQFSKSKIVKIDTDGHDFRIIKSSVGKLSAMTPAIFYECSVFDSQNGANEAISVFNTLIGIGYRHFMVYDNFGNYMIHLSNSDIQKFIDLTIYLIFARPGNTIIHYYDICAFHESDADLFSEIRKQEHAEFIR